MRFGSALALAFGVLCAAGLARAQTCNLPARVPFAGHNFPLDTPPVSQPMTPVIAFPNLPLLNRPVYITYAPDGSNRLFVVEQPGTIEVLQNDPNVSSFQTFLNITDRVYTNDQEMGLLGLAFDPQFATNHYFYVNYTTVGAACLDGVRCSKVSRFTVPAATPNDADETSELEIIEYAQPYENHKAGMMAFGRDGDLWISTGDGGSGGDPQGNAQNVSSLLGKMLRIDPRTDAFPADPRKFYSIPPGNPYSAGGGGAPEWWARGLRNPWRWSFDRLTGDLVIGDVGQDAYEEVDYLTAAQVASPPAGGYNFGWNQCEGFHDYGNNSCSSIVSTPPIIEYGHTQDGGYSITGGFVYRGNSLPGLYGAYLYADFVSERIWSWNGILPAATTQVSSLNSPSSWGEDRDGELYITQLYQGRIWKLTFNSTPPAPFPSLLSQTGLFANTASLTPAPGLVEYDVNTPLWSDRALKRRWVALPAGQKVHFKADGSFDFPVGTALVKHFELPVSPTATRRLETRVFLRQVDRWTGFTYRWSADGSDATLLSDGGNQIFPVDPNGTGTTTAQRWHYPSPSECLVCHSAPEGRVLGPRAVQLNRSFSYSGISDNQIHAWSCLGMFDVPPQTASAYGAYAALGDTTRSVNARARSYLASNCAICHQPAGPAPSSMDLRSQLTLAELNAIGVAPSEGDLGLPSPQRIKVGVPEQSVVWYRQQSDDPNVRMPKLSAIPDPNALPLFDAWIRTGLTTLDSDDDGVVDSADNCPRTPNPSQDDGGSFGSSSPDGIGAACQCGDTSGDGRVDAADGPLIRAALAKLGAALSGPANARCDSPSDTGECTIVSWARIQKRLSGAAGAHDQSCRAATIRQP
ncbi:MAG TPA: PQQ-dependent sugar dehydrogenase [Myxococcota bacterium]|nr:PQQ-dependent sugar dehydrogenase [Myxococcota bacterium]